MERYVRPRHVVAVMIIVGVAACGESLAPERPRPARSAPSFGAATACRMPPCPPGDVCAAVCEPIEPPVEVVDSGG
jgi:hypothetical protein